MDDYTKFEQVNTLVYSNTTQDMEKSPGEDNNSNYQANPPAIWSFF